MIAPGKCTVAELRDVSLAYRSRRGVVEAVSHVSLTLAAGRFMCIVGPSGSGKSSLANIVAGVLVPTSGECVVSHGGPHTIGYMMQEQALLPWRDVIENVALPLELAGVKSAARGEQSRAALRQVGLDPASYGARRIDELSGGERRRVSLAAALVSNPTLLVLDEPCGELDWVTKQEMQLLVQDFGCSPDRSVMAVTHDLAEAAFMADEIHLVIRGRLATTVVVDAPRPRPPAWRESDGFRQCVHRLEDAWIAHIK